MRFLSKEVHSLEKILKRIKLIKGEDKDEVDTELNIELVNYYNKSNGLVETYVKYRNYLREEINKYQL